MAARLGLIHAWHSRSFWHAAENPRALPGLDGGFMTTAAHGPTHTQRRSAKTSPSKAETDTSPDDRAAGTPTANALQNFLGALRQQ